jgi:TonB family protein
MITRLLAAASMLLAGAAKVDGPAVALHRTGPDYPASCMAKPGEVAKSQEVTVVYRVTRKGEVENARVRETTDACFNEAAIAAVRSWRFEPARSNGDAVDQEDLETTFKFVFSEATTAVDFDARPSKRFPPRYPEKNV